MTKTPPDDLVKQWKAEWTRMRGDNPYYFTRDKFIAAKACAWQRERDAALEPEIPADIKGRVQAEWFWKGVLAMKSAIKQQEKSE